jgi:hypothetical protein
MRKRHLAPVLAATALVACDWFAQTEDQEISVPKTDITLDLGHFDPQCNSSNGSTTYQVDEASSRCHVSYDKQGVTVADMAAVRQLLVSHGFDAGSCEISFHGQKANDMSIIFDHAALSVSGPVATWAGTFQVKTDTVASLSATDQAVDNLLSSAKSFELSSSVLDEMDTAWNNMQTLDAHIHFDFFIDTSFVPAMVAGGDLKLTVTIEIQGTGKVTCGG